MDILQIVLKKCEDTLVLLRDENDPLLNSMYIYNNLGVKVDVSKSKYIDLEFIITLYFERLKIINDNGLTPLYEKLHSIDRNKEENLKMIKTFILDNYKINVEQGLLSPRMSIDEIIDNFIKYKSIVF